MGRKEVEGREFDWFAVDGSGHIGHFATAGCGPVPAAVRARLAELRDMDERVLNLPTIGDATGHLPGQIEDWLEMAKRGLFAYDWKHWSGPYRRAATPSRPITVVDLGKELRHIIALVTWPDVCFADAMEIRPEKLCECG
jgi:hypothetical protein